MRKEILSSRGRSRTRCSGGTPVAASSSSTRCALQDQDCATSTATASSSPTGTPTRAWSARSCPGPRCRTPSRWSCPRPSLPRPATLDYYATLVMSMRTHPGDADTLGDPARAAAALEGARHLQRRRLHDPGSPTPSSTPTPAPRSASPPPRASSPSWSPATCWRSTWPRSRAPSTASNRLHVLVQHILGGRHFCARTRGNALASKTADHPAADRPRTASVVRRPPGTGHHLHPGQVTDAGRMHSGGLPVSHRPGGAFRLFLSHTPGARRALGRSQGSSEAHP